jgi:hypothetical protein
MASAASTIQSHWKKKKGLPPTMTPTRPPATVKAAGGPPSPGTAKPVAPPASRLVHWMRYMAIPEARTAVVAGLRVKVRFASDSKVRSKDGKVVRKRVWYGGRISAVSKEGSKSKYRR